MKVNPSRKFKPKLAKAIRKTKKQPAPDTLLDRLKPFVGLIKNGPRDLAENHKKYASGEKKWK